MFQTREFLTCRKLKLFRRARTVEEDPDFLFQQMQQGQEREISALVSKVFEEFVAPDYSFEGRAIFQQFINPATIYSRNFPGDSFTLLCKDGHRIVGLLEV